MAIRPAALWAAALLAAGCGAPEPVPDRASLRPVGAPAAAAVEPQLAPLERALAAVEARALAADVAFLADDALGGRATPSSGQRVAARFLRARLERLGLEPAGDDGWFHRYALWSRRIDPAATRARLGAGEQARALGYGVDFGVHPADAQSGAWSGPAVYCGEGRPDELAGLDLAGRWAVCVGEPFARRRTVQRDVREAGALGLVMVPDPVGGRQRPSPFGDWSARADRVAPRWPGARADEAPWPSIWLSRDAGARLVLGAGGKPPPLGAELAEELALEAGGGGLLQLENVAALLRGREGELADQVLVVSAHYDHVGTSPQGEVFNGADDNASGTAALLGLAEALVEHGPLARSVLLLWVGGEELGLYGSRAWTEAPCLPAGLRAVANLNVDMIGRNAPQEAQLTPTREHPARNSVADALERALGEEGFTRVISGDEYWERSDHAMFAQNLGLPVAFLSDGDHDDYHQPSDDAEKIDAGKIARAARALLRTLVALQAAELEPPRQVLRRVEATEGGDEER